MSERTVFLNGEYVPESEAKVSIFDAGFRAGDGVYEMTRTYGGAPFRLDRHLRRLESSMRYMQIDPGLSLDELEKLTHEVLNRNRHLLGAGEDYQIWHNISRGVSIRSTHGVSGPATVAIYCVPLDFTAYASDFHRGAHLVTPAIRRTPPEALDSRAKITNKSNHIQANLVESRCYPLMLDLRGFITESSFANFFVVSGETLLTPSLLNVLEGITRMEILEIAGEAGIPVREGDMTIFEAVNADEAFLCTTSFAILPAGLINGQSLRGAVPGKVTMKLIEGFSKRVGMDILEQALRPNPAEAAKGGAT